MGLVVVAEDDEREVDHDVGVGDEALHRVAVEDVAVTVVGPLPARARPGRKAAAPSR